MTKGTYTHIKTAIEYELLDDNIVNKDNESRMVLYCQKGNIQQWYVRSIDYFQKQFKFNNSKN